MITFGLKRLWQTSRSLQVAKAAFLFLEAIAASRWARENKAEMRGLGNSSFTLLDYTAYIALLFNSAFPTQVLLARYISKRA